MKLSRTRNHFGSWRFFQLSGWNPGGRRRDAPLEVTRCRRGRALERTRSSCLSPATVSSSPSKVRLRRRCSTSLWSTRLLNSSVLLERTAKVSTVEAGLSTATMKLSRTRNHFGSWRFFQLSGWNPGGVPGPRQFHRRRRKSGFDGGVRRHYGRLDF
jgi:hypothetical protein